MMAAHSTYVASSTRARLPVLLSPRTTLTSPQQDGRSACCDEHERAGLRHGSSLRELVAGERQVPCWGRGRGGSRRRPARGDDAGADQRFDAARVRKEPSIVNGVLRTAVLLEAGSISVLENPMAANASALFVLTLTSPHF